VTSPNSITVIVPALNEETHLEEAVMTIVAAAQRGFEEYEVLVFNDGSTDRTGEIAEALAQRFKHVTAIHHDSPQCIGGVIRRGLERARMRYVIWVDGKGATPAEALDQIFARRGDADLVVPFAWNQYERSWMRRVISRLFRWVLNTTFRLQLHQYTHLVMCETKVARRIRVRTDSYAYQAEALIKLVKSGCSYVQVGVRDNFALEGRRTKAFKPRNVAGVVGFFVRTVWDVYVRPDPEVHQQPAHAGAAAPPASPPAPEES
jgi:dolichol-phosphate mannosyltransferase